MDRPGKDDEQADQQLRDAKPDGTNARGKWRKDWMERQREGKPRGEQGSQRRWQGRQRWGQWGTSTDTKHAESTLQWVWRYAFSQSMPSEAQPDHLSTMLQTGTPEEPTQTYSNRRDDYMQVLRRSRAHKERLCQKHKPLRKMQGTGAHCQYVPPPTGICASREAPPEVATPSTGTKASTRRLAAMRNLRTRQYPRVQMGMRQLWRTGHRRRRQSHEMPRVFSYKGKKREPNKPLLPPKAYCQK